MATSVERTRYACEDCKDTGLILLFTSAVRCECADQRVWIAAYDNYEDYVQGRLQGPIRRPSSR